MQTGVSIAIPKYQTALIREGLLPLQNNGMDYLIIQYIKTHYKKNKETTYFEIYR
jgi:ribosomal protein S24E